MLNIKKYKFIIILIVLLPIYSSILSELYTYYFQPLKYKENIPAKIVIEKSVKGVRHHLAMHFTINNYPYRSATIWANHLKNARKSSYNGYINKEISASLYYKVNPCTYCYTARKTIPIYAHKDEIVFLNTHESRELFFDRIYSNLSGLVAAFLVLYLFQFLKPYTS